MQLALIEKDCSVFDFIEHYLCQRANNTQISYRGILREWCANFNCSYGSQGAAKAIKNANRGDVLRFLKNQTLRKGIATPDSSSLTKGTVFKKFKVLRGIYDYLLEDGLVKQNPFSKSLMVPPKNSKPEKRKPQLVPFDSVNKIIQGCKTLKEKAILSLLFGGGLRRSEVADLRISDCEFFKDDLLVTLRKPKSGHEQTQSIPIWAANAVRDLIQQAIDNGLSSSNYLIPGKAGRIGDTTIYRIFRRCLKRAGLKGSFSPHSARATAITKLLSDGVDPRAVQEFARHSDFYVTQRYDLREGLGMRAAKKLKY